MLKLIYLQYIEKMLRQSLIFSRNKFIEIKDNLKDIAITDFKYLDYPREDHILFVLSQIQKT